MARHTGQACDGEGTVAMTPSPGVIDMTRPLLASASASLELPALAEALFCSSLQPSQRPTAQQVWAAVSAHLGAEGERIGECLCQVAQEAGDHPEAYVARMSWCRQVIAATLASDGTALSTAGSPALFDAALSRSPSPHVPGSWAPPDTAVPKLAA